MFARKLVLHVETFQRLYTRKKFTISVKLVLFTEKNAPKVHRVSTDDQVFDMLSGLQG